MFKPWLRWSNSTRLLYVLSRLNLTKLDEYGYREFSEEALNLAGKMISADAKSAKSARALLQKVSIRDNTGDHASYLKLADSCEPKVSTRMPFRNTPGCLRSLRNYPAVRIVKFFGFGRFTVTPSCTNSMPRPRSGTRDIKLMPPNISTRLCKPLRKSIEKPPPRQSGEYSLYKLVRALIRVQYARRYEAQATSSRRRTSIANLC